MTAERRGARADYGLRDVCGGYGAVRLPMASRMQIGASGM